MLNQQDTSFYAKELRIKIIDLAGIMAREKVYTDIFPKLRDEFLFEPRKRDMGVEGIWTFSNNYTPGTTKGNYYYWMNLLHRWAGLRCDSVKESLEPIRYIGCHQFDKRTGKYKIINREETNPDYRLDFISLYDLRDYLKYIEEIYAVFLPLPIQLFPETNGENITGEVETESEHQEEAKKQKHPPVEVVDLLRKAKPEIEDLYKGMSANRQEPDCENGETYWDSLKYAAEEWFNKAGNEYQIITKKHVTHHHIYYPNTQQETPDTGHISRDFKGRLCQVLIVDTFSNEYISDLNHPPKGFGVKTLYELLNSIT